MKIYRNGVETYDLNINHETVVTNRMMVENTVVLQYSSTTPLENLKIGDYFTIDDERYELNELPEVRISDQMVYSYTALFVGHLHTLDNFLIDRENFNEKFFYFGNAQGHLDFILEKINKVADGYSYTFDEKGVSVEPHNMDYGSMSVLSAMHKFCEVFGCEFDLQGKTFRIAKKLEQPTDSIFQVGKGKGLYSIVRGKLSNEKITTVLYALGGKTNMMNDERLSLDGEKIESNVALYGIREEKVVFENIYPRCNQAITSDAKRISENSAYWSVEVANMNFDLGKCILEDPLIEFTTGNCMGVQFKIIRYDDASKTIVFEEKSEEMNDGMTSALPNDTRKPMSSDTLHFLNILLPDRYVVEAKQELRKAAEAELAKRSVPQAPYTVEIDSRFLVNKTRPRNGDLVRIVHEEIGLDALIRIIGMTYPLTEPDNMRLTISDNILVSGSQSLLQTIRKDIQTAVASGVRYHPLMGNFSTPLAASEVVSKLIKNKDFDGFGFEKKGFAIGSHPTLPDQTIAEVDYLNVRKRLNVYELTINQIKHMGGKMIYSAASMEISKVEELENGEQKVYFDSQKGQLKNLFAVHDLALCQHFDTNSKTSSKQYHRAVTAVGEDFIVLLPNLTYSGIAEVGDIVIQYGNTKDPERQHAYTIDVIGGARTSFVSGLDRIGATGTIVSELGFIDGKPQFSVGDQDSYIRYNAMDKLLEVSGKATFQGGSSGLANLEEWNEAAQDIQAAQAAADEAKGMINGLPYVGRNLVRNSAHYKDLTHWSTFDYMLQAEEYSVSIRNDIWSGFEPAINLHALRITEGAFGVRQEFNVTDGNSYVLSLFLAVHRSVVQVLIKGADHSIVEVRGYDYFIEGGEDLNKWEKVQIPFVASGGKMILSIDMIKSEQVDCYAWFKLVKLEQGDRSTEWSPAYEDTEEGIANAKQAGETAQQEVLELNHYVDGAFRDGVIDSAEAVAIEKYINQVNDSFAQLDSTFSTLYNNPILIDDQIKTQLYDSHITLIGSKSALLSTINNAIADGKTNNEEKQLVDSAYLTYRQAAERYQASVEQVNLHITNVLAFVAEFAFEKVGEADDKASNASAAAGAAQSAISAMNNDTVFDMVEKQTIRTQWEQISGIANITGHHGANGSYYKALTEVSKVGSLSSARDALNTAYNALLGNLSANELYINTNKSGFNRSAMATAFTNYGNAEVACYNAIQEHYTSIAQQTANTATVPTVVVETSVDQVLRGEDFTPSTLSARRVLKVGDRREVLDKERLLLPYSAEWTCSGWSSEQPLIVDNDVSFKAINGWQTTSKNLGKNVKRLFVSFQMAKAWNPAFKYFLSKISDYPNENQRIEITPTTVHPNFMAYSDVLDWDSNVFGIFIQGHDAAGQRHELYLRDLVVLDYSNVIDFSGRNYLNLSNSFSGGYGGYGLQVSKNEDAYLVVTSSSGNENYVGGFLNSSNKFDQLGFVSGDKVTAILWIKTTANRLPSFYFNQTTEYVPLIGECSSTEFKPCYCTISYSKYESGEKNYHLGFNYYGTVVGTTTIKAIKFIKGEYTPQDWQPAPEDAMLKLNGADYSPNTPITIANNPKDNYLFVAEWNGGTNSKNVAVMSSQQAYDLAQQAKNKADSHQYLSDVITSGGTNIEGGLVLGNMLGVKKNNTKAITGAIVGDKNNSGLPFLFGGAPHTRKDGSIDDDNSELAERAKNALFNLYENSTGRIGNLIIYIDEETKKPRLRAVSENGKSIIIDPNVRAEISSLLKRIKQSTGTMFADINKDNHVIFDLNPTGGHFTNTNYQSAVKLNRIETFRTDVFNALSHSMFMCYTTIEGTYTADDPILQPLIQEMLAFFKLGSIKIELNKNTHLTLPNSSLTYTNVGIKAYPRDETLTMIGLYATITYDVETPIQLIQNNGIVTVPAPEVSFLTNNSKTITFQNKTISLYVYNAFYRRSNYHFWKNKVNIVSEYKSFDFEYILNLTGTLLAENGILIKLSENSLFRSYIENDAVNVEFLGKVSPKSNIPHLICAGRVSMGETRSAIVAGHGFTLSRIQAGRVRITHNYGSMYYIPMVSKEHSTFFWDNNVMVADVGSNSFDVISFSTASSEVFEDCIFSFQMIGGYAYGT